MAAVLEKGWGFILGRCGEEADGCVAGEREGSAAKLVGLFLGATGAEGCLWSSLIL